MHGIFYIKVFICQDRLGNAIEKRVGFLETQVRHLKEAFAYVAADFSAEDADSATYDMPDGRKVSCQNERYRCVEPLFQPSLMHIGTRGIHELTHESVQVNGKPQNTSI